MNVELIIQESILDSEVDPRNESGIFDASDPQSVKLFEEYLRRNLREAFGADPTIHGTPCMLDEEGKHPERQAFNKEGWLVTFPSKEYKDRAIKKGTHFASDPTHGKGGMNLYYKKKGKQQRQKQQDVSSTDPRDDSAQQKKVDTPQSPQQNPPQQQNQQQSPEDKAKSASEKTQAAFNQPSSKGTDQPLSDTPDKMEDEEGEENSGHGLYSDEDGTPEGDQGQNNQQNNTPQDNQPQQQAPKQQPPVPKFAPITLEFAASKGWSSTPYGDWKSKEGEVVAVTSLSGEVTPIQSVLRDELKLFVQKKLQK